MWQFLCPIIRGNTDNCLGHNEIQKHTSTSSCSCSRWRKTTLDAYSELFNIKTSKIAFYSKSSLYFATCPRLLFSMWWNYRSDVDRPRPSVLTIELYQGLLISFQFYVTVFFCILTTVNPLHCRHCISPWTWLALLVPFIGRFERTTFQM